MREHAFRVVKSSHAHSLKFLQPSSGPILYLSLNWPPSPHCFILNVRIWLRSRTTENVNNKNIIRIIQKNSLPYCYFSSNYFQCFCINFIKKLFDGHRNYSSRIRFFSLQVFLIFCHYLSIDVKPDLIMV